MKKADLPKFCAKGKYTLGKIIQNNPAVFGNVFTWKILLFCSKRVIMKIQNNFRKEWFTMLNSLVLRALSGFMAVNMATAPISTQGTGDVENSRYYGRYETHLPTNCTIVIDSSGCRLEKFYRGNPKFQYAYVNTTYTRDYTMSDTKFTANFSPNQVTWVNANGVPSSGSPATEFIVEGNVEVRNDSYAPRRRYITVTRDDKVPYRYWVDLK